MNKLLLASLLALAAGSASAQLIATSGDRSSPAPAQDQAVRASKIDPGDAAYRRYFYGDTTVGVAAIANSADESAQWAPGPYARYLMYVGASKTDAIAQAMARGERPSLVAVEPIRVAQQLNSYERYQRWVTGRSDFNVDDARAKALAVKADPGLAPTASR
jgi:hypothetical protein